MTIELGEQPTVRQAQVGPVTYRLEKRSGTPVIVCLVSGVTSYHPQDVRELYCAHCCCFHGDRVEAVRRQFLLGGGALPAGVAVVWVDSYHTDTVLCVHPQAATQPANLAFGVKTLAGWRVVQQGDWIVTLLSGEQVIERNGVWCGVERSPTAGGMAEVSAESGLFFA